jgi:nucleotide-binding universal stress UspA family protein
MILPFRRRNRKRPGAKRVLVPFTRGRLDPPVLDAAIRIAAAEHATLVPAYLIMTPLEFALDAPMHEQVAAAMPLLEAVENAALKAGVPVDARIESGRTPIHALQRLWNAESFDRIVVPASPSGPGFTPKDILWILMNAPSETVILRPQHQDGEGRIYDQSRLVGVAFGPIARTACKPGVAYSAT